MDFNAPSVIYIVSSHGNCTYFNMYFIASDSDSYIFLYVMSFTVVLLNNVYYNYDITIWGVIKNGRKKD